MFINTKALSDLQKIDKSEIIQKVQDNAQFNTIFLILLIGSIVVCTLGLLMNATAIVIGGMIISPLMWPLMQTSIGMSYGRPHFIKRALWVLFLSTIISILAAFVITYVSPVKFLTSEILARTTPTLLDVMVALVAGCVAALAITQPKVSESLAGVAIATSLIPPIAVSGIGLALGNTSVFIGGFLLYVANIVSIVFVSMLMFLLIGLKNQADPTFQKRAVGVTAIVLILTSIPLMFFLRDYTFRTAVYSRAENSLDTSLTEISSDAHLSNLRTNVDDGLVKIEASVLIPEGVTISYADRQSVQESLETALDRRVSLELILQRTISVVGERDLELDSNRRLIEGIVVSYISDLEGNFVVDKLDVRYRNESWLVDIVLVSDPSDIFRVDYKDELYDIISGVVKSDVEMNIEIVARVRILTQDELDALEEEQEDLKETELDE